MQADREDVSIVVKKKLYRLVVPRHEQTGRNTGVAVNNTQFVNTLHFPPSFSSLKKLKSIRIEFAAFTEIPSQICGCKSLTQLSICSSEATSLPEDIGLLKNLDMVNFSDNELQTLPDSFSKLTNIKELDLSGNQFTEIPEQVCSLKKNWTSWYVGEIAYKHFQKI